MKTLSNHTLFSMMHSVKVKQRNTVNISQPSNPNLLVIHILPSSLYYYSHYNPNIQKISSDYNLSKKTISNIKDFLKELDQEFGDSKFTCYLSVFKKQEIHINQLIKLLNFEYIIMGITLIEYRQILCDEAKKYE